MRPRSALIATGAILLSCLVATPQAGAGEPDDRRHPPSPAVWSAKCFFVEHQQVDPIVSWGQASAHMHTFAASDDPGPYNQMTPEDLRDGLPNDCNSPNLKEEDSSLELEPDRSSYWTPALTSTSIVPAPEWTDPAAVLVYYRNAGIDPDTIAAFEQDLVMVAGKKDATLTNQQDLLWMDWSCVAQKVEGAGSNEVNFGTTIPTTCPKELVHPTNPNKNEPFMLRLVLYFPNCVNRLTSFVENKMVKYPEIGVTYAVNNPDKDAVWPKVCPDGFTPIPQVQIGFRWALSEAMGATTPVTDTGVWSLTKLKISSDVGAGQDDGVSAHTDFMSGWSTLQIQTLMQTCFWSSGLGPRRCGSIADSGTYEEN